MRCAEARQLLPEWLEGEAAALVSAEVESHIASCPECRAEAALWRRIAGGLREMSTEIPAPAGFAAGVTARLSTGRRGILVSWSDTWKRAVAAAAAVTILACGSLGIAYRLLPNLTVADNGGDTPKMAIIENNPGNDTVADPVTPDATSPPKPHKQGVTPPAANPPSNSGQGGSTVPDDAVTPPNFAFLSTDRKVVIHTTLVRLQVEDISSAYQQAATVAKGLNGSVEVLAVQDGADGRRQTVAAEVPLDKADQALAKLTGLGQTLERKPDIKDVSATYNEKAVRYNSLLAEWQATGDANQKVLLEAEMNALKKQLDDLSRKAERQTIVLILEG
ncbi:zf-HC2 domain-containing protein [Desulforudis sp. DRI-14]|uniref:zf-HC2 domain-containing protein n=1 Tax=Desulforudis sp. DRI-14 TaxID=3459793 RepID=UPI004041BA56